MYRLIINKLQVDSKTFLNNDIRKCQLDPQLQDPTYHPTMKRLFLSRDGKTREGVSLL